MSLPVAMQLYSVREDMLLRPVETLRQLKKMGYQGVEPAGLCSLTPEYFKGACDALELEIKSAHVSLAELSDDDGKVVDIYKYLGCKYVVVPYLTADDIPGGVNFADTLTKLRKAAEKLKAAGIQMLYHNHADEFKKVNGDYSLDILCNSLNEDLLKIELDTGWANYSKVDPAEYILSYKGRIPAVHLKDYDTYDKKKKDNSAFLPCPFGLGILDVEKILQASVDAGAELLVVEQDSLVYKNKNALKCAEISRKNLRNLGF